MVILSLSCHQKLSLLTAYNMAKKKIRLSELCSYSSDLLRLVNGISTVCIYNHLEKYDQSNNGRVSDIDKEFIRSLEKRTILSVCTEETDPIVEIEESIVIDAILGLPVNFRRQL